MPKAARNTASATPATAAPRAAAARKPKLPAYLVTGDDMLWPQIGAELAGRYVLTQLDGIDELLATAAAGAPAIVLWDARGQAHAPQALSRIQLHSTCFAVVALDESRNAGVWTLPIQHRQVVAHVGLPLNSGSLGKAIDAAAEEVQARVALLGESPSVADATPAQAPAGRSRTPVLPIAIGAVALAAAAGWALTRHHDSATSPLTAPHTSAVKAPDANQEKLDALIERAQQAMADRHFIDPAAGSALSLYRDALLIDPANGEARQGLDRLAEILVARIQSALDERKFDVALQSLETVRSINGNDPRLPNFDEKITAMRAELGPAQVMAAINAQNFDRAAQLLDDANRARSLPAGKLAQLRDELRKRREDADQARLLKLVDTRLQQEKLVDPRNDSAASYLELARQAGVTPAQLQGPTQDLQRRLALAVHAAIEQRRFTEADRWLGDLRDLSGSPSTIAGLQHDLTAARSNTGQPKAETPSAVDLVQQRLAQGRLGEPDNDSALSYLNQLRSTDPKNAALPSLSSQLQAALLERARAAIEAGDLARAETSLQQTQSLGASADAEALTAKVRASRAAAEGTPRVAEQSLTRLAKLEISYPARAQQAHVEGWVEIGFTVKADGGVADIKIVNANPAGAFDQAATKAVSKLRYQPVVRDGKPTAVTTQMRVVFRIPT